jgi:hypothetical protein
MHQNLSCPRCYASSIGQMHVSDNKLAVHGLSGNGWQSYEPFTQDSKNVVSPFAIHQDMKPLANPMRTASAGGSVSDTGVLFRVVRGKLTL